MKTDADISKKQRIVLEARQLFLTNGYEKTTMEEIARSLAIGKGTLYSFFPNKEEILLAICTNHFNYLEDILKQKMEETKSDYLQSLIDMFHLYINSVYQEVQTLRTPEALIYANQTVQTRFADRFIDIKNIFRAMLQKAIDAGELSSAASVVDMCEVILAALTSFLPPYQRDFSDLQPGRPPEDVFERESKILVDLLLQGLRAYGKS
ncbi:MAG: TetR/AcrR family transcriptional regulator [Cyanobacteria bacterium SZAS TMP-1]|nr:TetR/AcrR family transcriptional regulator [Cyanobacteria bacterium SZAS TMP-1]